MSGDLLLAATGLPCSLCWNGEVITLPEKEIAIQGFEFINTCQALADFVPILFQQESDECATLQSIGTLCGCPPKNKDDFCNLCSNGTKTAYGWRELAFLAGSFGGIIPTCEIVEPGLHSYSQADSYCEGSQQILSEYCGCGAEPGSQPPEREESGRCSFCPRGEVTPFPNKTIDIAGFPFQTCGQLDVATVTLFENKYLTVGGGAQGHLDNNCILMRQLSVHCGCRSEYADPCPICKLTNSYEVPYPDKMLDSSSTSFFLPGVELSCGLLAEISMVWSTSNPDHQAVCSVLQGIGTDCGCPLPEEPSCEVCAVPLPQESYKTSISNVPPYDTVTCAMLSKAFLFMEDGSPIPVAKNSGWIDFECRTFRYFGFVCGCNDGIFEYWGAETVQQQRSAVWVQRVTAFLSLLGSIAILVDIVTTKQRNNRGMYYHIMFGLSLADILSSIAWGLGPVPANADIAAQVGFDSSLFRQGELPQFYGAHGNDATCKAQGFLLHLGFTSILYNASLSYFFKLSVVDGWRESNFTKRYRWGMLGIPAIIGVGVAFAAIPFITSTPIACTIGSSEDSGGWSKLIGLFYLPYGPAFIFAPLNTCFIYWKVRKQSRKGDRWRIVGVQASSARSGFQRSSFSMRGFGDEDTSELAGSERTSRMRQMATALGRTISFRHPNESQTEKLVFWQSFWYVVSFFLSYSVFLVAFALDGWNAGSYWFYILLSILTPMQGFFNCCVFFRSRIVKKWRERAKRAQNGARFVTARSLMRGLLWPMTATRGWLLRRKASSSMTSSDHAISTRSSSPDNLTQEKDKAEEVRLEENVPLPPPSGLQCDNETRDFISIEGAAIDGNVDDTSQEWNSGQASSQETGRY